MIRTERLSKYFDRDGSEIRAVDGLDLQVNEGEVFGFLGPNGAGKTTTVRMLACLIAPTSGRAWVNGMPVGEANGKIRGQIGLLTESPGLYERLSARRNLEIFAELVRRARTFRPASRSTCACWNCGTAAMRPPAPSARA